jgi:hypothetical protein
MDRWNTLLPSLNHEFIRTKIEEILSSFPNGVISDETIYSSKLIQALITSSTLSVTSGVTTISNMMFWGKMRTASAYNGKIRKIELVSDSQLNGRLTNILSRPLKENPVAKLSGVSIYIFPTDISSVILDYIQIPVSPFLDYYKDANYKTQFLNSGVTYTLKSNEVYRDHTTSGVKASQTVELQIPVNMHAAFQDYIIEKLSLIISDQYINQVTMAKEAKEESK